MQKCESNDKTKRGRYSFYESSVQKMAGKKRQFEAKLGKYASFKYTTVVSIVRASLLCDLSFYASFLLFRVIFCCELLHFVESR